MAKLVYATDLKFVDRKVMWVRFPPRALKNERSEFLCSGSVCPATDALGIERRNMSRRARRDSEPVTSPSRAGEARGEVDSYSMKTNPYLPQFLFLSPNSRKICENSSWVKSGHKVLVKKNSE